MTLGKAAADYNLKAPDRRVLKRAFVGLSTPLGYDYLNLMIEPEGSSPSIPNPFLESVNGLLLCYDEIWFPSREFCPKDLQHLDYVHFLEDSSLFKERALVAIEQAKDAFLPEDIPEADYGFKEQQWQIIRDRAPSLGLDNHSRHTAFGMGNAADGNLFSGDLLMAASLDFEVDVIVNSALAGSIHALQVGKRVHQIDPGFVPRAVEDLAGVHTLDFVTRTGSYHESIEDLRGHARIAEFRQFLGQEAPNQKDFVGLVAEVNRKVDAYAAMAMAKYLKGDGRLYAAGSATLGTVGNIAHPGAGSVLSGALNVGKWMKEGSDRKKVGWSMFVLDIKKNRSSRGRR